MITTPIPQTNLKNGQPPLDNTRPFMDDTGEAQAAMTVAPLVDQITNPHRAAVVA